MKKCLLLALLACFNLSLWGEGMQPIGPNPIDSIPGRSSDLISGIELHNYSIPALEAVQELFQGKDVDYYVSNQSDVFNNLFFIDAEPMTGWEHDCYLVHANKKVGMLQSGFVINIDTLRMPPVNHKFTPIKVRARYGEPGKIKPFVRKAALNENSLMASARTYAVILSGGASPTANYNRYWNDCSFIYQTLVNKYGVPKENIYPIMSDGDDPGEDMYIITESPMRFESQPLDLDFDGIDDIKLAATKTNLSNVFNHLSSKLTSDDHLFFYVIDHGGKDKSGGSVIYLWNNETINEWELTEMFDPLASKSVNINVVLGQCYSGGFMNCLTRHGIVATSACGSNQVSYACPEGSSLPYDEYVYQWTCAINEADHLGRPLGDKSDRNGNGIVTMQEAYRYAMEHDRHYPKERPIYKSSPASIGEDLAFDNIPQSVDLYIKDHDGDTGVEPNTDAENFWTSPSIWIRNENDGIEQHENPILTEDHDYAYIYVRIHNRGKFDYAGKGLYLHTYYANASTVIRRHTWVGMETDSDGNPTGANNRVWQITKKIPAGGSEVFAVKWDLSNIVLGKGSYHFCIYAKILDTVKDESYNNDELYFAPWEHKGQAQKNVVLVKRTDLDNPVNIYVRNSFAETRNYSLRLVARTTQDKAIFSKANIELEMSPTISNAWERGGGKGSGIYMMSNSPQTNYKRVKLETVDNKIEDINMYGSEFDKVSLKFNFTEPSKSFSETYTVDLVQYDEDGNILGGETFIVEAPIKTQTIIEIQPVPTSDGLVQLTTNSKDFKSVSWRNTNGETIGKGEEIVVKPVQGNDTYEVVGYTEEGGMAVASVCLEGVYGIKSLSPAASVGDNLTVELCSETGDSALMSVSSVVDGTIKLTKALSSGSSESVLDVSSLQPGLYTVSYMINGEVTDTRKFTKK